MAAALRAGVAVALVFSQLWTRTQAQDVPSVEDFLVRHGSRVTVIGDYAYIDGGHISYLQDGKAQMQKPVNQTLSIDLSRSWNASDVQIRELSKDAPRLVLQSLFTDETSDSFYIWGGYSMGSADRQDATSSSLWKFTADGDGGGSWNSESQGDAFADLVRSQAGVYVSTGDSGFHFGGESTSASTSRPEGPVPGYFHFNFTSGDHSWQNETEAPYSDQGTIYGATATWAPTFGPNGLIVLVGGESRDVGNSDSSVFLPMDTIHFMDPVTKTWYKQRATGEIPGQRIFHCSVGVGSSNGTFEIFVFGGHDENRKTYDRIHVLSLPSFEWTAVDSKTDPRAVMGCALVGQRQILTVGGTDLSRRRDALWTTADRFPQGLGIFDLTESRWKTGFDADAGAYESPESVRKWYEEGKLANVEWGDGVQRLFGIENNEASDNNSGGAKPGSDESIGSDKNEEEEGGGGGVNAGAIAGGVVAAVVVLGLVAFATLWFLRRRRRKQSTTSSSSQDFHWQQPETKDRSEGSTPVSLPKPVEMPAPQPFELHSETAQPRTELGAQAQSPYTVSPASR